MRKMRQSWTAFCLLLVVVTVCIACSEPMTSPNGKIVLTQQEQPDGTCSFAVAYNDGAQQTEVMNIPSVGLLTQGGRGTAMRLTGVDAPKYLTESYTMLTGKRRACSNEATEYLFHFTDSLGQPLQMRFRLYNDGVTFRYELPGMKEDKVKEELTTYRIAEGTKRWMQSYTPGYEDFYPMYESGAAIEKRQWGYPALVQAGENAWTLISESDVNRLQSGSFMNNEAVPADYKVQMLENKQPLNGDWHTPWRVLIVGSLQDVVASTLITDTSVPCTWEDTSWVKPGNVSWIYWAHNHGSKDYQLVKQYIDMAVELKLPYVLIDWEWDVMGNGGTIEDAVRYATERGIRPLMWYNSSTSWADANAAGPLFRLNAPENREKEFAWLSSIGVAGVKIDFFPEDTETTMAYYQDLLETAAKYKLLVNFHGSAIPRGWQRTYSNYMSSEAVYGAEWYNNNDRLTTRAAVHNATLPFTRNVIGPMDYTPCTFSDSQHPHITSHAHELALPVLFESALQHWADRPESYLAQPAEVKNFMGQLPTVWDETRLLSGYPGEYVVMARRNGDVWYVAGLNGSDDARVLTVDWSFLPEGLHSITLFEDSGDKENPWKLSTLEGTVKDFPVQLNCRPRGGFVAVVCYHDSRKWGRWTTWGNQHDGTYQNPILPLDFSDIDCIRVGDDYYAISSTFQFTPGMTLLHSKNLVDWEICSNIVEDLTQIGPELSWKRMNRPARGIWAGTLRYHEGRFYLFFGTPDEGYFMTSSPSPQGPWDDLTPLLEEPGWDDCTVMWDEDGTACFVGTHFADGYKTYLFKMAADGKSIDRQSAQLIHAGNHREANKLIKVGDWYYLVFSEHVDGIGRYVMARRSKKMMGPYKEEKQLALASVEAREPNQGGIVEGKDGHWYFLTHHGSGDWSGRIVSLLPVTWKDGWPIIGKVLPGDIGTMTWSGAMPTDEGSELTIRSSDDFDATRLPPQWQWNYQPRKEMFSLTERPGWLRLRAYQPLQPNTLLKAGNTLTQRSFRKSENCVTIKMDLSHMSDGQRTGLCHFSSQSGAIGLVREGGATYLEHRYNDAVTRGAKIESTCIWLQTRWGLDGKATFHYSLTGDDFTSFGQPYQMVWGNYRGDRIGIYSFNDREEKGWVDVDYLHYQ